MITTNCKRYGHAMEDHFWIINAMPNDCHKELEEYAKEHPEQTILYSDCGTKPGHPIPIPETVFEVYTPKTLDDLVIGWKIYQTGKNILKKIRPQTKSAAFF